jgi:hypothetical protein
MGVLTRAEVNEAFSLDAQLNHVDAIFDRVFVQTLEPARG